MIMEKFFIIENEKLIGEIQKYEKQTMLIFSVMEKMREEFGIETKSVGLTTRFFAIKPTEGDREKFKKSLNKNGTEFRKNSKISKRFFELVEHFEIGDMYKPDYFGYTSVLGRSQQRMFQHKGVYYGSITTANYAFTMTDGFVEIPGSEFYKIMKKEKECVQLRRYVLCLKITLITI